MAWAGSSDGMCGWAETAGAAGAAGAEAGADSNIGGDIAGPRL